MNDAFIPGLDAPTLYLSSEATAPQIEAIRAMVYEEKMHSPDWSESCLHIETGDEFTWIDCEDPISGVELLMKAFKIIADED